MQAARTLADAGGPLKGLVHRVSGDIEQLRAMVQLAIQLEFTTIPVYLVALYSIKDPSTDAYQALRSVVVEEMFHLNQAANLLIGVGGRPKMTGGAVPVYPCYLPSAAQRQTPYVGLYRASLAAFQSVYMAIETPAPYAAPAEGREYTTIGQFYKAIEQTLDACVARHGAASVFKPAADTRQRTDIYLGKFGGRALEVTDLDSAKAAIQQIVQQGEGAVNPTQSLVPAQPYGAYNHYGRRVDGTYGPILGTPFELSHYYKFKHVVESGAFPDTYPCISNPRMSDLSNPQARRTASTFNSCYSVMLNTLEQTFRAGPEGRDIYFEITLPLMHQQLPALALQLVTTPILVNGDAGVGPTAAATFEYDAKVRLASLIRQVEDLRRPVATLYAANVADGLAASLLVEPLHALADPERLAALAHIQAGLEGLAQRASSAGFDI